MQFTGFYLTFPSMIALTNGPNVRVTPTATYINLNYLFRDQGNEYQVSSQTHWSLTLVKTPFITWSLYALTLAQKIIMYFRVLHTRTQSSL